MVQKEDEGASPTASGGVVQLPENWTTQLGWLFDVANYETFIKVVRLVQMWQGIRSSTDDAEGARVSESVSATQEPSVEQAGNWPKPTELPDPDADFQAFREAAEEDAMRYAESQWEPLDISNLPSPDAYARAAVGYAVLKAYLKPRPSGVDLPEVEAAAPQDPIDAVLFAVALDRVRRDKGVRHTLEDVVREMDALDDPLPEASSEASQEVPEAFKDYDLSNVTPGSGFFVGKDAPPAAGEADTTPPNCGWYQWMSGWTSCDRCARPAWEHEGMASQDDGPWADEVHHNFSPEQRRIFVQLGAPSPSQGGGTDG